MTACVWLKGETDTISETIEGLVSSLKEAEGAGEYEIGAAIWSAEIPMRFAAGETVGTLSIATAVQ